MKLQEKEKKMESIQEKLCMSSGMQSDDLNVFQVTFHS